MLKWGKKLYVSQPVSPELCSYISPYFCSSGMDYQDTALHQEWDPVLLVLRKGIPLGFWRLWVSLEDWSYANPVFRMFKKYVLLMWVCWTCCRVQRELKRLKNLLVRPQYWVSNSGGERRERINTRRVSWEAFCVLILLRISSTACFLRLYSRSC